MVSSCTGSDVTGLLKSGGLECESSGMMVSEKEMMVLVLVLGEWWCMKILITGRVQTDHELSEMNERIESKISKRLYKLSQGIWTGTVQSSQLIHLHLNTWSTWIILISKQMCLTRLWSPSLGDPLRYHSHPPIQHPQIQSLSSWYVPLSLVRHALYCGDA